MIYRMLVLFSCCWGSNLSIHAEVGKFNGDLLQPSRIRYEVWSFSVRHLISIAYWKGLISGVKLSVVVPQAIEISLRNTYLPLELEPLHLCRCPIHFLQEPLRSYTSMLGIFQLHQAGVISHFEMRTSNVNSKRLDLTNLRCPSWFWISLI